MRQFLYILSILLMILISFSIPFSGNIVIEQTQDGIDIQSIHSIIDLSIDSESHYSMTTDLVIKQSSALDNFRIEVPLSLYNISITINSTVAAYEIGRTNSSTTLILSPSSNLEINDTYRLQVMGTFSANYLSNSDTHHQFLFDWNTNLLCNDIDVTVILPKYAIVQKDKGQYSIFPNDVEFGSTGDRITITWKNLSNTTNLNTKVFVQFETHSGALISDTKNYSNQLLTWILISIIVILLSIIGAGYYYWQNHETTISDMGDKETKVVTTIKPVILTPQEQELLTIIAEYDGGIMQSELVDILNYSRARVSQYLTSFEKKGLITKHKAGRQNYITIAAEVVLEDVSQNDDK